MKTIVPSLLVVLLATSCGPSEQEVLEGHREAARTVAAEERQTEAEKNADRAQALAVARKPAEAWAAWRAAREVLGETPKLERIAAVIRESERLQRRDEAYAALTRLLERDRTAETEEARLAALREAAAAAREFLEAYPEHEAGEEIRAALEYIDSEIGLSDEWTEAIAAARKHLKNGEAEAAVLAIHIARRIRDGEEIRALLTEARRALTPKGMVLIPEGTFPFGKGRERTFLPAFYVDVHEVTNAAYQRFVKATGHPAPSHFKDGRPPAGKENHPVVNVTLDDALAFAAWAGTRVPTEIEWERAARGTEGRDFPWGAEWDDGKGNFGKDGTKPVGSHSLDRSPDGVFDMGGNVMELTLDRTDPAGATAGPVMKGGHWSSDFHREYARTWSRWPVDRARKAADTGFRCVKKAP
ncbi:MAG: SUMF1/EgtB/PvdO family nonheme iron enzyme [Planctomycetota bacterium]